MSVRVCAFPASRLGVEELFNWALEPAEDHILDKLFELGYLDAAVWAEENPVGKTVEDESASVENGSATYLALLPDDLTQVLC
ncbi:hypothetical protein Pint_32954 [Pistacia integerrima]|uniref:Uncharacterized protein n=1 Tax=Pistacia integerrima TaxID=434235 RepID=A0ACC0X3G8_9ROSI|nr:hypothetical protein Pint_32954 [Pistacia integerrima]